MERREFKYWFMAERIYFGLICVMPILPAIEYQYWADWVIWGSNIVFGYITFVLFLGLGFRPYLIYTGLHDLFLIIENDEYEFRWRGRVRKAQKEREAKKLTHRSVYTKNHNALDYKSKIREE